MSKELEILEGLVDNKVLKKMSNDTLLELGQQYSFSNVLDILINKKHLKENGNLSLLQMSTLVSKMDNPGLAFSSVVENSSFNKKSKSKKKRKSSSTIKQSLKGDNKSKSVDLNQGVVSEQLAEIYVKQGMINEAIAMYKSLSLQNPNKSVFFAEILKKLNKL